MHRTGCVYSFAATMTHAQYKQDVFYISCPIGTDWEHVYSIHYTYLPVFDRPSPLVFLKFCWFLSGFCKPCVSPSFVRWALGHDGVCGYGVSAWLTTDWGWSHRSMEAIFRAKDIVIVLEWWNLVIVLCSCRPCTWHVCFSTWVLAFFSFKLLHCHSVKLPISHFFYHTPN